MVGDDEVDQLADAIAGRLAERLDVRPLFSPKSLAKHLGISERVVREMIRGPNPELESFLVGDRNRRISAAEVDRYLASRQDRSLGSDQEGSSEETA